VWLPTLLLLAQNYAGPVPEKADVPYVLHADDLIATEAIEAKETKLKDGTTYIIPGANSPARTPLASPVFLLKAEKLDADKLQVFPFQTVSGHREITFSKKKNPRAYTLTVKKLAAGLYRLEVNESLPNGEYAVTPASDSNLAFCFAVY
jgi:hypothetical protein